MGGKKEAENESAPQHGNFVHPRREAVKNRVTGQKTRSCRVAAVAAVSDHLLIFAA